MILVTTLNMLIIKILKLVIQLALTLVNIVVNILYANNVLMIIIIISTIIVFNQTYYLQDNITLHYYVKQEVVLTVKYLQTSVMNVILVFFSRIIHAFIVMFLTAKSVKINQIVSLVFKDIIFLIRNVNLVGKTAYNVHMLYVQNVKMVITL